MGGGWHPDLPNRNAAPGRGRPARLIRAEGDDTGPGYPNASAGNRQSSPIQGILTRLRFRHRLLTRSTTLPLPDAFRSPQCRPVQL